MDDSKLVYSTDPARNQKCPKCKNLIPECNCKVEALPRAAEFTAVLRVETAGRKGKIVTVIGGLPRNEMYLARLEKILKTRCGAGGTHRMEGTAGIVEIQGDSRELIRTILSEQEIKFKG